MRCQACYAQRHRSSGVSRPTREAGDGRSGVAQAFTSSVAPASGGASTDEGSGVAAAQARVRKVKAVSIWHPGADLFFHEHITTH